jgi:4'-phosphopantetheinyl transferase
MLAQTLTPDETGRAERFFFEKDKNHFVAARGVLRDILSRYLSTEPAQIRFQYNDYGKPALGPTFVQSGLTFNLSHAHGLALYAIAHHRQVGIDLEYIRALSDIEQIAERFFSNREQAAFRSLPDAQKRAGFFNCWTRKEAYIKARGQGLSFPLDRFDVSLRPGAPAALLEVKDDPQERARWSLQSLTPAPSYVAAVAVEGFGWQLKQWQWS